MSEAPGFHYKAEEKHCNKACLFYLGWRAGYPAKHFSATHETAAAAQ
jgi:hypothetical protein